MITQKDTCEDSFSKIYKTLKEDKRCEPVKFLPHGSAAKLSILTSFPGSGNTWTRHLIEQASQIFTGSVYNDGQLYESGWETNLKRWFKKKLISFGAIVNLFT